MLAKLVISLAANCRVSSTGTGKLAVWESAIKHRDRIPEQDDLPRPRLVDLIALLHALVKLAALIDWDCFKQAWAGLFPAASGRLATHSRLFAELMSLQHTCGPSDKTVVARWVETRYPQHFTGETFFQYQPSIHPSSLSRRRGRFGEEEDKWRLSKTIDAGRAAGLVDDDHLSCVSVDTTVMENNIAHPTPLGTILQMRLPGNARASL